MSKPVRILGIAGSMFEVWRDGTEFNPLADIRAVQRVSFVLKEGRVFVSRVTK